MDSLAVRMFKQVSVAVAFALLATGCNGGFNTMLGETKTFAANLDKLPSASTSGTSFGFQVTGDGVASYRYKFGLDTAVNCTDPTGYSANPIASTIPITDDLSSYLEQTVKLCVIAVSTTGVEQSYSSATMLSTFVDSVFTAITIVESEQSMTEVDSSAKVFTLSSTVAKPYDIYVNYIVTGDATPGVDHSLAASGVVKIPAGATTAVLQFNALANATSMVSKNLTIQLKGTDRAKAGLGFNQSSHVMIYDTDGGTRPTVASYSMTNMNVCVILSNGVLKCWGSNEYGQLGDGTTTVRGTAAVVDAGVSYSQVMVGYTTCGLTTAGVLKCWGLNASSQLANGTTTNSSTPVVINSGTTYKTFRIGGSSVCAITSADILQCWGYNATGQLGDGTLVNKTVPTAIGGTSRFASVSMGGSTTCAITTAATGSALYCWGLNTTGQMGDGTLVTKSSPTLINSGTAYANVQLWGVNTCAIATTGSVLKCWGGNTAGQVGDGTLVTKSSPTVIDTGVGYASVTFGNTTTCGVTTLGALKCWGLNGNGQVGDGSTTTRQSPVAVDASSNYVAASISTGGANSFCGVTTLGALKCWGLNSSAELGDGTTTARTTPVVIDSGVSYASVQKTGNTSTGIMLTCGVTTAGSIKCWGTNNVGQIGDGQGTARLSPTVIDSGVPYSKVTGNNSVTCGLTTSGGIKCWGVNGYGSVGDGSFLQRTTPVSIDAGTVYREIVSADYTGCGITSDDVLKCWGNGGYGTPGQGSTANIGVPTVVDAGTKYSKIVLGDSTACGITTAGVLKCWGYNAAGQVGNGTLVNALIPTIIDSGTTYASVITRYMTTCGITTSKVLKCWGTSNFGQVGAGAGTTFTTPTVIDAGVSYKSVQTSWGTTCALTEGGTAKCWGYNLFGEVGVGSGTSTFNIPQTVDAATVYADVMTFTYTSCGITNTGVLKCWGFNSAGQLGNGTTTNSTSPIVVNAGTTYSKILTNFHSCALTTTKLLHCFGDNSFGQTGDGTNGARMTPTLADSGAVYNWIALGTNSTFGITTAGVLKTWGRNDNGQLGDGVDLYRPLPRSIMKWVTP